MDLVLDALISPAREWRWKDRADFHQALAEGLIDQQAHEPIKDTASQLQTRLER